MKGKYHVRQQQGLPLELGVKWLSPSCAVLDQRNHPETNSQYNWKPHKEWSSDTREVDKKRFDTIVKNYI